MSNFRHVLFAACLCLPQLAFADGENQPAGTATESSNFGKTNRFIAGEEVVTPTGKKVKVWSTEGPVPVSQAPQPFQDKIDQRLPENSNIVIDSELLDRRDERRNESSPSDRRPVNPRDSFEVNR